MKTPLPSRILEEWHPTKNLPLLPENISSGSGKKIWWKCKNNHVFESSIARRSAGSGCPVCSNKQVLVGFNDLAATHPDLASEWHPTKNFSLLVSEVTAGSSKKVWWVCGKGHEWEAVISSRRTRGCSVCSNRKILAGFNDLATMHHGLAVQWHPTKNALSSSEVGAGSNKKSWWVCDKGHEWEVSPNSRIYFNSGCPTCANKKLKTGFNDLATTHPELAAEWHPTKNGNVFPTQIIAGSHRSFWWLCSNGHAWKTEIDARKSGNGCPVCSGKKVFSGFNDLATVNPNLAAEWHPTKNGILTPSMVTQGAAKKIWWICDEDHSWETAVTERNRGKACPVCAGQTFISGCNDLGSQNPTLAAEWHPTKNGTLTPSMVGKRSIRKVWWLGVCRHEWEAAIYGRVQGYGCPQCSYTAGSLPETELYEFITNLGCDVERSNRSILKGKEIDLYLPAYRLGIEFNGLYWHNELSGKGKNYHHDKFVDAQTAGVQLIQIWEDDWNLRKLVILRALAHKLGLTAKLASLHPELGMKVSKVFARKTAIVSVTKEKARFFLEQNHIQGFASGSHYVGLEDTHGVLRALMVLKKEAGNTLNIIRYATSGSVTGGFTKLLASASRTYQPDSFITFTDHTISDGGLYENNGFVMDKELAPDYMYVVRKQRKHKFGYRLKKFRDDPNLLWDENLTERELAILNNIPRIWDAGKTRYRKFL